MLRDMKEGIQALLGVVVVIFVIAGVRGCAQEEGRRDLAEKIMQQRVEDQLDREAGRRR